MIELYHRWMQICRQSGRERHAGIRTFAKNLSRIHSLNGTESSKQGFREDLMWYSRGTVDASSQHPQTSCFWRRKGGILAGLRVQVTQLSVLVSELKQALEVLVDRHCFAIFKSWWHSFRLLQSPWPGRDVWSGLCYLCWSFSFGPKWILFPVRISFLCIFWCLR